MSAEHRMKGDSQRTGAGLITGPQQGTRAERLGLRLALVVALLTLPLVVASVAEAWHAGLAAFWPVLLWLIILVAVWLIAEIQLGGPMRHLTRTAQAYRSGDPAPRPAKNGPADLRGLAETLEAMAAEIVLRERDLREAIATREAMLREIHHRVKNNLQIVTSLLNLQAKSVQGESARRAFGEIQTRVRALALVHRYLYESDDLQSVNLGAFLRELAASLQLSYGISEEQVAVEIHADEIWDIADRAVPLALFMTEAMTNALKHAFPPGRSGIVRIVLRGLPDRMVQFSVEDNGVGLSEDQAIDSSQSSLGMALIKAFARQVDGKLTISGPPGTVVAITFINKMPAADRVTTEKTQENPIPEPARSEFHV
jgi:two-component sensor histidine kinase